MMGFDGAEARMFGKSAEDKAADQLAAQQRSETAAAEEAQRAYASSPVGRAEAALARGDRFFQIHLPVSSLSGDRSWFGSTNNVIESAGSGRRDGKPDVLTQIEDVGWHLEHVGYVFIETGATSSSRVFTTGQGTVTEGAVHGIYLFRAV
jgi:hypothetical protein